MAFRIGRTKNVNDTPILSNKISVGKATSTKLLDANVTRSYVAITVLKKDIWLKLQAAGVDDDKKGILIQAGQTYETSVDNIATCEISAIALSGIADVYTTEF